MNLSDYPVDFIDDMPLKLSPIAGRISKKMSQPKSTPEAVKASKPKYSKTRGEHAKDLVITALIIGIIAFVGGMTFQSKQQDAINTAVKGAHVTATPEVKK
jgi:hypothetical protein